jgi:hypothetical protein
MQKLMGEVVDDGLVLVQIVRTLALGDRVGNLWPQPRVKY